MAGIEGNGKAPPKEGESAKEMGSSPGANRIFNPSAKEPYVKRDLYSDLEKIEERGKRKKSFSLFGRDKK